MSPKEKAVQLVAMFDQHVQYWDQRNDYCVRWGFEPPNFI